MGLMQSVRAFASGFSRSAFFGGRGGGYEAGRHDVSELNGWAPGNSAPDSISWSESDLIVGRARDSDKNNAWINGALDRRIESVIGKNIRLLAQPEYAAIGKDFRWRAKWARGVESHFKIWANDVDRRNDARRRLNFGAMMSLAYLHYVRDGEVGAEIRMNDRGGPFKTNVMLVDCDRISNPNGQANTPMLTNGVEKDESGAPIAYHVRKRHPNDTTGTIEINDWVRIPAYTRRTGRARFVHVFNPRRIDQSRGVSRLAEAMVPTKMLDRVDRAEVEAALLSALMSFFIESPSSLNDLAPMIAPGGEASDTQIWTEYIKEKKKNPLRIAGATVRQLLPGEKIHAPQPTRPNPNYADFQRTILQKIAGSMGISYPQLSQDWEGINYSSARALLNEMWRSFLQDRDYFTQHFCTPIYAAWMEEAVSLGLIEVPAEIGGAMGFYRHKTALTMCEWLGPSRGSVDPLKEASADAKNIGAGLVSTTELILERNRTPGDILDEEALYQEMRAERGLGPQKLDIKADSASGSDGGGGDGKGGSADDRDGDGIANEEEKPQRGRRRQGENA